MSQKILHINSRLVISAEEFERNNPPESANVFLDVPGLLWKIGYVNRETLEAGGVYLFKDEATLQAFLSAPIAAQLLQIPIWKDVTMKTLDILVDFSKILQHPLAKPMNVKLPDSVFAKTFSGIIVWKKGLHTRYTRL